MKTIRLTLALSLIAAPAFAQAPAASADPGVAAARLTWNIMTGYVTRAAEQVSEADYAYKPTDGVRSFGELFGHIAGAQYMFCSLVLGDAPKAEDDIEKTVKTKAGLVAALKASTEYCGRAYGQSDAALSGMIKLFGQDRSKMFALSLNAAHNGEHYGNIVTYMRMKGMVPPSSQQQGQ